MPLPKFKYIVAPSVDFMQKQSYPRPEEADPSKFVLPMPQSIRVNLVYRGALLFYYRAGYGGFFQMVECIY